MGKALISTDSRYLALQLLLQVVDKRDHKYRLDKAIRHTLDVNSLSEADARLLRTLVLGTCRHWHALSWLIEQYCTTSTRKLKPVVSVLLRLGFYQLIAMDKIPAYAAVESTVNLAKQLKQPSYISGLINAVLRAYLRVPQTPPNEAYMPAWLTQAQPMMDLNVLKQPPPLGLRLRPYALHKAQELSKAFLSLGWTVEQPFADQPDQWLLHANSTACALTSLPGFQEGCWVIQDASSASVAPYIPVQPRLIVDVCAGLGMKSIHLADRFPEARVIALEPDEQRFQRLQENIHRLQLGSHITLVQTQAENWSTPELADVVLIDAPCSATGTLRRHPEILVQWDETSQLAPILAVQAQLLETGCQWVKPQGILAYSNCSILPAENQQQVQRFCNRHPAFTLTCDTQYDIRNTNDGFYIAIISR